MSHKRKMETFHNLKTERHSSSISSTSDMFCMLVCVLYNSQLYNEYFCDKFKSQSINMGAAPTRRRWRISHWKLFPHIHKFPKHNKHTWLKFIRIWLSSSHCVSKPVRFLVRSRMWLVTEHQRKHKQSEGNKLRINELGKYCDAQRNGMKMKWNEISSNHFLLECTFVSSRAAQAHTHINSSASSQR
jgi:hypothetical protein